MRETKTYAKTGCAGWSHLSIFSGVSTWAWSSLQRSKCIEKDFKTLEIKLIYQQNSKIRNSVILMNFLIRAKSLYIFMFTGMYRFVMILIYACSKKISHINKRKFTWGPGGPCPPGRPLSPDGPYKNAGEIRFYMTICITATKSFTCKTSAFRRDYIKLWICVHKLTTCIVLKI